ncbi:phosphopantetheine-binding protein [Nonomuraea sp. PA05]|uniref:phosphopantetheine-binding protein n=1 Tax=Nonomuraea sp. PA05 TaxID=2604466 RepID=UPI0016524A31|nr:phosphopantetheine-binding protein [Nonomuraea sp. PA05]
MHVGHGSSALVGSDRSTEDNTVDELHEIVTSLIEKTLGMGVGELDPDTELNAAGLTSLRMVELMTELEERLSIEFPDEMIEPGTFRSARSLTGAVRRLVP